MTSKSQTNSLTRVLIAEDSPVMAELLTAILQSEPGIQVVGIAENGIDAVRLAKELKPDIITMDVHMPEMDGYQATRQIMQEAPRPIVIVSNSVAKHERDVTFNALQMGALSVLNKPTMHDQSEIHKALIRQIKLMSEVKVVRRWVSKEIVSSTVAPLPVANTRRGLESQIVAIASSTGGPAALATILSGLPADFPAPILIVQHITIGFGQGLATWLDKQTSLTVQVAQHGDKPIQGQVLLAPDHCHMKINNLKRISLFEPTPQEAVCPAADHLFHSLAQIYGNSAIGILLTGMGQDGADGLKAMHAAGAFTIAQNEETCVVFGMPKTAIRLGAVQQIQPISNIAPALLDLGFRDKDRRLR